MVEQRFWSNLGTWAFFTLRMLPQPASEMDRRHDGGGREVPRKANTCDKATEHPPITNHWNLAVSFCGAMRAVLPRVLASAFPGMFHCVQRCMANNGIFSPTARNNLGPRPLQSESAKGDGSFRCEMLRGFRTVPPLRMDMEQWKGGAVGKPSLFLSHYYIYWIIQFHDAS